MSDDNDDNVLQFKRSLAGLPDEYDGSEECNHVLESSKDEFNRLLVMGFDKDHQFKVYHSELPAMHLAYLEKLLGLWLSDWMQGFNADPDEYEE